MEPRPWYVITGGPCAGKTSIVRELARRGYMVVDESARAYIEAELARGKTLAEIRADEIAFQHVLIPMKVRAEEEAPTDRPVFFDRGMHDSIVYLAEAGVTEDAMLADAVRQTTYQIAFLPDLLPFESDAARTEDAESAKRIHEALARVYEASGIPVVRVPVASIEERADFILASI